MRRLFQLVGIYLALATTSVNAAGSVGAYIWGGQITIHSGVQGFYDTVDQALVSGFDTIRVKIGPNQVPDYYLTSDPCISRRSLSCYAEVFFDSSVWDNPGLKTVMITATDFTCVAAGGGDNKGCYSPALLTAQKAAIKKEYTDLFQVFHNRFSGRDIRLIVSNWEGDNFVFCGKSYDYGQGGNFTNSCNATLSKYGLTKAQAVQGFLQWVSYKDEAVASFVAANPLAKIISAPEFNNLNQFATGCGGACSAGTPSSDSILGQIQAAGGRKFCSYSSYDSQSGPGGPYYTNIQKVLAICQKLIIGEAGYGRGTKYGPTDQARLFQALGEISTLPGIVSIIPWNAVTPPDGSQAYGMWDANGRPQILPLLGPIRPTPQALLQLQHLNVSGHARSENSK